jgi:hypothetical protein
MQIDASDEQCPNASTSIVNSCESASKATAESAAQWSKHSRPIARTDLGTMIERNFDSANPEIGN